MWIHLPNSNTSASTQEEADSTLPSNSQIQVLEQSVTWRGKHRALRSWLTTCKRDNWMMRLSLQIPEPSTVNLGVEKWISSLEDSLVSPPPLREDDQDKTTSDGFSLTLGESCQKRSHRGCSWRMCVDSYLLMMATDSKKSSGTWPTSGTMLNGVFTKQPTLEPLTDENEPLSMPKKPIGERWSTPTARDVKGTNAKPKFLGQLPNQVAHKFVPNWKESYNPNTTPEVGNNWASPTVSNANDKFKNRPTDPSRLMGQVVMWATPMAADDGSKATVNSHQRGLIGDADRFHGHPVQQALSGGTSSVKDPTLPRLNPKFVEWLMGWPEDWVELTNFAYLETE